MSELSPLAILRKKALARSRWRLDNLLWTFRVPLALLCGGLATVGVACTRQWEIAVPFVALPLYLVALAMFLRCLASANLLTELRSRRILDDLLGTGLTHAKILDGLVWLSARECLLLWLPVWPVYGLMLALEPHTPLATAVGGTLLCGPMLAFWLAVVLYGLHMVCAWGQERVSYAKGLGTAIGVFYAPILLVALAAIVLGSQAGMPYLLMLVYLALPLIYRGLAIRRLARDSQPPAVRRRWWNARIWPASFSAAACLALPRRGSVAILAVWSVALVFLAGVPRQPVAAELFWQSPSRLVSFHLSLFMAAVVISSLVGTVNTGSVRRGHDSGVTELWQSAGLSASRIVDGWALGGVLAALWPVATVSLIAGHTYPVGLVAAETFWCLSLLVYSGYSGVERGLQHSALTPRAFLGALVFLASYLLVPVALGTSLYPHPAQLYVGIGLAALIGAWMSRRACTRTIALPR